MKPIPYTRYILSEAHKKGIHTLYNWLTKDKPTKYLDYSINDYLILLNNVITNDGYNEKDVPHLNHLRNQYRYTRIKNKS